METKEELKARLRDLFGTQALAVLATQYIGAPYASLVADVGTDDLKEIFFATPRTTRKYRNMAADPRVALLINSSQNKPSDFHEAIAVTVTGIAEDVQSPAPAPFLKRYLGRHPHLKDFIEAPSTAMMRVRVDCYYIVKNFQKVMELRINQ